MNIAVGDDTLADMPSQKSFATMPNSIKAIHENLRKIEPRIRCIKGTQGAHSVHIAVEWLGL